MPMSVAWLGRVNRDRVGMYGPEELLVAGLDFVKWRPTGWNMFPVAGGAVRYRIVDAAGVPLYPPVPMTLADLDGVAVLDAEDMS